MGNLVKPANGSESEIQGKVDERKQPAIHRGKMVEYVVRRSSIGISEISRKLYISRRTLYNWFESEKLSLDIIRQIGCAIDHDFSKEFPKEFNKNNLLNFEFMEAMPRPADKQIDQIYFWMEKYIQLLEKINESLCDRVTDIDNH